MKIFITGGTGFIGQHVVRLLAKKKHRLFLLSRNSARDKKMFPSKNMSFVNGDLASLNRWKSALKRFKPDVAVHMAWEGIPDYGTAMSMKNLQYGVSLFEALIEIGCLKIVAVGSCWELTNPNAFAVAKNALREFGNHSMKNTNAAFIWARPFFVYGPGQKKASLIPFLISQIRSGTMPQLKSPDAAHDFVYIEDVALALLRLITKSSVPSGTYDIGTGTLTKVSDVANMVCAQYAKKGTYHSSSKQKSGMRADVRGMRMLGREAKTSIKKGIQKTIQYYES
jgi:dTDP-6-deoxy-L-talose 4-dehydrogenase (NAD+)